MSKIKEELLIEACEENRIEDVKTLVFLGVDVNATDKDGYTPLHISAEKGYEELAFLLLFAYSANPDSKTKHGVTPLHIASLNGRYSIVENLLTMGANANPHDLLGYTPSHLAYEHGYPTIVELFKKIGVIYNAGSPSPEHEDFTTITGSLGSLSSEKELSE